MIAIIVILSILFVWALIALVVCANDRERLETERNTLKIRLDRAQFTLSAMTLQRDAAQTNATLLSEALARAENEVETTENAFKAMTYEKDLAIVAMTKERDLALEKVLEIGDHLVAMTDLRDTMLRESERHEANLQKIAKILVDDGYVCEG